MSTDDYYESEHARLREVESAKREQDKRGPDLLDPSLPDSAVDAELRRLGVDPVAMGERGEAWAAMADARAEVPKEVHERGWQWRPIDLDTAFAPPFGTIRVCRDCGCLVAGGPTICLRCAKVRP